MPYDQEKDKWLRDTRREVTKLLKAHAELDRLNLEQNSRGWSGTFDPDDFENPATTQNMNSGVTNQAIGNALGSSDAIKTLFATGHYTNLYELILHE